MEYCSSCDDNFQEEEQSTWERLRRVINRTRYEIHDRTARRERRAVEAAVPIVYGAERGLSEETVESVLFRPPPQRFPSLPPLPPQCLPPFPPLEEYIPLDIDYPQLGVESLLWDIEYDALLEMGPVLPEYTPATPPPELIDVEGWRDVSLEMGFAQPEYTPATPYPAETDFQGWDELCRAYCYWDSCPGCQICGAPWVPPPPLEQFWTDDFVDEPQAVIPQCPPFEAPQPHGDDLADTGEDSSPDAGSRTSPPQ